MAKLLPLCKHSEYKRGQYQNSAVSAYNVHEVSISSIAMHHSFRHTIHSAKFQSSTWEYKARIYKTHEDIWRPDGSPNHMHQLLFAMKGPENDGP